MCAGAIGWAQIPRIVYGASDPKRGFSALAPLGSRPGFFHPKAMVEAGLLADESAELMRNFFRSLPEAVFESAKLDGAGYFRIFFQIAIPMAQVGIITVGMLYALAYWNDYYNALMFIRKTEMYPMQYYLYNILSNIQFAARQSQTRLNFNIVVPSETIKMAIIIVTIVPILFLYPFIQRYIVKGVIVGAVKG